MERSNYSTNTEYLQSNSIDGYTISLKDHVYYAKVMPSVGTYELYDLIVRAITQHGSLHMIQLKGQCILFYLRMVR